MIQDSAIVSTGMGDRGTSIGIEPTESAQVSCELQVSYIVNLKLFYKDKAVFFINFLYVHFINRTVT